MVDRDIEHENPAYEAGDDDEVGYGKPPRHTRFQPGHSGNPKGRPPGSHNTKAYPEVLDEPVEIMENGQTKTVTMAEAFLLVLAKDALHGDKRAVAQAVDAINKVKEIRQGSAGAESITYHIHSIPISGVYSIIEELRIGRLMDRFREKTSRYRIENWVVQAALDRLKDQRFTIKEQRTILKATRNPKRIKWPRWWTVRA